MQRAVGAYHPIEVTDKQNGLVNGLINQINQKLSLCVQCWTVAAAWSQVVSGTNYYFYIIADSGDYATVTIFYPLPNTNCAPRLEHAEYGHIAHDEEKLPPGWVGGFSARKVDNEIRELVRSFRRQLNDGVNHVAAAWVVNTVWSQVVSGTNYLIQCTSNKGVFATVKIYAPGSWTKESPRISWSGQGHRNWRNYDKSPLMGGYQYSDVETKDRRYVSRHFDAICKQSGVDAGSWVVNECQSQVVNGVNLNYTLTSDCGVKLNARFFKGSNPSSEAELVGVNLG